MFGWELPPYNSGGLGTACLGMTESLTPLGVSVDFVLPKVMGDFPFQHMKVFSAADYAPGGDLESVIAHLSEEQKQQLYHSLAYSTQFDAATGTVIPQGELLTPDLQANWYAEQATSIAEESNFDVIHTHDWMTYYAGMAAQDVAKSKGKHAPLVAHVHATEIDRGGLQGNKAIAAIEKKGLQAADRVIAVSEYTKKIICQYYKIPAQKISVVHNGIRSNKPARYNFHALKKHYKLVLFMGRLTTMKGPEYYLQLAKAVTEADPNVKFLMVGNGDMERQCIEQAARMNLTGKILFSTFLRGSDVDRAYQLADVYVDPSTSQPFGLAPLEALQNGTPVIISKNSGVLEVSPKFIPVDFWDIDAMKKAVLDITSGKYQSRISLQKRELRDLSWDRSAQSLRQIYQELLLVPQATPAFTLA